jgi:Ca2+-binding EF-hand superfamily protein
VYAECSENLKGAIEVTASHILAQSQGAALSAEQAKEIRETFDVFDSDKSGRLTLKEFQDGLQGMGLVMSDDDSKAEFVKRDLDNSESLSFEEFAAFILEQFQSGSSEADIQVAFNGLCDGKDKMDEATMNQWFAADQKNVDYMNKGMPSGEYGPFVVEIFKV